MVLDKTPVSSLLNYWMSKNLSRNIIYKTPFNINYVELQQCVPDNWELYQNKPQEIKASFRRKKKGKDGEEESEVSFLLWLFIKK